MSKIWWVVLLGLLLCAVGLVSAVEVVKVAEPISVPPANPMDKNLYENITKIVIEPRHKHVRLKPGETKTFAIKLKNPNDKEVIIEPRIVVLPFDERVVDKSWISFDKSKFTLKPKEEKELKITVSVPGNAEKGYHSCMIAFTNDALPTPYPAPIPAYINQMTISIDVWIPPSVKIYPRFIDDRVEAGKSYEYRITIENTRDKTFRLNPKLREEEGYYYEPFSPVTGLTENIVSISAPSTIPPKSKATLTVKINVPSTAKGILRGCIDLGIDDPGLDEWMQRVDINLGVYERPTEPFVKTFAVENASKITVKVSGQSYGRSAERGCEFSVKIVSPDGVVSIKPSKLVEAIGVTLSSGKLPPWEEAEGIYTITSYRKTEVYTIDNPANGLWRVEVLPNCDSFDVEIEVE